MWTLALPPQLLGICSVYSFPVQDPLHNKQLAYIPGQISVVSPYDCFCVGRMYWVNSLPDINAAGVMLVDYNL